jgi:hypothetical protein
VSQVSRIPPLHVLRMCFVGGMKSTADRKLIIIVQDGKVIAVYELADEEAGIEVKLEKGEY